MRRLSLQLSIAALFMLAVAGNGRAQFVPGIPLRTTLVLVKPGPDQTFGSTQVILLGVKDQIYKFGLADAYVDDPTGTVIWDDVWRSVEQSRPNMQVQGEFGDKITQIKPGETMTVHGVFAPLTKTFEVVDVSPGKPLEAPKHY